MLRYTRVENNCSTLGPNSLKSSSGDKGRLNMIRLSIMHSLNIIKNPSRKTPNKILKLNKVGSKLVNSLLIDNFYKWFSIKL